MAAKKTMTGSIDSAADGPQWLDQVMGCLSPPFSFRKGGSAVTDANHASHRATGESSEGKTPGRSPKRG